ncbi:hypothetical protein HanRHA438_Chr07g0321931 [Helianthus annuus]|nr:hypothetical protein HanRHA438_Chr07g0321931 [Helianthus annuus]
MARVTTSSLHHNGIYFTFSARDSHSLFFNSHKSLRPSNKLPFTYLSSVPPSPSSPSNRRRTLVSTVPVEYVPPPPGFRLRRRAHAPPYPPLQAIRFKKFKR